ncbi:unnamed protein product [Owenia fusiformis]|uniref:Uncharacterized protein n=1 Tax=Owenia fusiformis TaxID=6347 RepID=A0A8J1XWJ5_OWEFU|nr:unnamed protein product [Owenia fusiformis]
MGQPATPYQKMFEDAVKRGDMLNLQTILEDRGGKINVNLYDTEGQTALHQGCLEGNLELVKLLVNFGADVRLCNRDGWAPLHIAAYGGHNEITLYLINANRINSKNARNNQQPQEERT